MATSPPPGGSPTGAQATDGTQLALRMIAAAVANANASASSTSSTDSWYKMLPRPPCFEPKTREEELSQFRDWWWQMEQYLVAIDGLYARDLEEIRQDLNNAISMDTATADEKKRANFLFSLLASLMKGRPLLLLRGISVGNGYEAVRQLIRSCQPTNRNRTLGLLQVLMAWPQFDMKQAMLPQILKLEDTFREYERIGGTIPTEMRFAILMKSLSGQLKTYLQITLQDSTSYDDLRESILKYDAATIKWSQTMSMGTQFPGKEQDDTAVPMDVDRVSKGKQKGKNKGKSKDKGKDAGKGKHQGKYSWGAGKGYNNQNNDYWNKQ